MSVSSNTDVHQIQSADQGSGREPNQTSDQKSHLGEAYASGHPAELTQLAALLKARRTTNFFSEQPVDHQLIKAAVEVAQWAPNHRLTEPWKFVHLGPRSRSELIDRAVQLAVDNKGEAAGEARRTRLQAVPEWLAVTSAVSEDSLLDREDYAATCCAIQNLMLFLWQAGVGCKWTTGAVTRMPETLKLLGLDPRQDRIAGLIWIGYPRQSAQSTRSDLASAYFLLD